MIRCAFDLICVTNRHLCDGAFLERIERIAESGIPKIILREKDLSEEEYSALAEKFLNICDKYKTEAILHTYADTAISLKARSIHLPLYVLRQLGDKKQFFDRIGVSCHSLQDIAEAESLGAGYATFGHVFATDCKKGLEPRGLEALEEVCRSTKLPVYAIGGINDTNIELVKAAGAQGACLMSFFMRDAFSFSAITL